MVVRPFYNPKNKICRYFHEFFFWKYSLMKKHLQHTTSDKVILIFVVIHHLPLKNDQTKIFILGGFLWKYSFLKNNYCLVKKYSFLVTAFNQKWFFVIFLGKHFFYPRVVTRRKCGWVQWSEIALSLRCVYTSKQSCKPSLVM